MDVALLFLGEDENGLHALEEGGDGAAAQELGAAGLIALGGVGPVVDRPAAFKGGKAVGLRLFARLSGIGRRRPGLRLRSVARGSAGCGLQIRETFVESGDEGGVVRGLPALETGGGNGVERRGGARKSKKARKGGGCEKRPEVHDDAES